MNETELFILSQMKKGVSLNRIFEMANISLDEFNKLLKHIRTTYENYKRSFHSDGSYFLIPSDVTMEDFKYTKVYLPNDTYRTIFISDLHIGNSKDRVELLDTVMDHAVKEGVHTIYNLGDLIENIYYLPARKLKLVTLDGQIKRAIKNYPYDKNVTHFILYGNHDYKALTEYGVDIETVIESERYDMVSLGYGENFINLRNDFIALQHNLTNKPHMSIPEGSSLVFRGHSHKMKYSMKKDVPIIQVPSLSDATPESYSIQPQKGFVDAEFHFNDEGLIERVYLKHYSIESKKNLSSEFVLTLRRKND